MSLAGSRDHRQGLGVEPEELLQLGDRHLITEPAIRRDLLFGEIHWHGR
jgi:hypothetical protein